MDITAMRQLEVQIRNVPWMKKALDESVELSQPEELFQQCLEMNNPTDVGIKTVYLLGAVAGRTLTQIRGSVAFVEHGSKEEAENNRLFLLQKEAAARMEYTKEMNHLYTSLLTSLSSYLSPNPESGFFVAGYLLGKGELSL